MLTTSAPETAHRQEAPWNRARALAMLIIAAGLMKMKIQLGLLMTLAMVLAAGAAKGRSWLVAISDPSTSGVGNGR